MVLNERWSLLIRYQTRFLPGWNLCLEEILPSLSWMRTIRVDPTRSGSNWETSVWRTPMVTTLLRSLMASPWECSSRHLTLISLLIPQASCCWRLHRCSETEREVLRCWSTEREVLCCWSTEREVLCCWLAWSALHFTFRVGWKYPFSFLIWLWFAQVQFDSNIICKLHFQNRVIINKFHIHSRDVLSSCNWQTSFVW